MKTIDEYCEVIESLKQERAIDTMLKVFQRNANFDYTKAYTTRAAKLGKSIHELSDEDKMQAVLNAILLDDAEETITKEDFERVLSGPLEEDPPEPPKTIDKIEFEPLPVMVNHSILDT